MVRIRIVDLQKVIQDHSRATTLANTFAMFDLATEGRGLGDMTVSTC